MDFDTYRLVFHGQIRPGLDTRTVQSRLAALFRLDDAQVGRLFDSAPVVVKKNLTLEQALQCKEQFEHSGALCEVAREDMPAVTGAIPQDGAQPATTAADAGTSGDDQNKGNVSQQQKVENFLKDLLYISPEMVMAYMTTYLTVLVITESMNWHFSLFGYPLHEIMAAVAASSTCRKDNRTRNPVLVPKATGIPFRLNYTVGMRFWGALLLIALCAWGVLTFAGALHKVRQDVQSRSEISVTRSRMDRLDTAMRIIQNAAFEGEVPFPDTPDQIASITRSHRQLFPRNALLPSAELLKDEWDTPMRYERQGKMDYLFRSAGPDKIFDTDDDLTLSSRDTLGRGQ